MIPYTVGSNHPSPQVYDFEGSQKSSQTQLAQVQIADQALLISWFHSIDQHNSEALRRLRCPRWGFQTSIHLWWPPLERKAAPLEERPCPVSCPFRRGDRNLALHMWIIVNIYNKQAVLRARSAGQDMSHEKLGSVTLPRETTSHWTTAAYRRAAALFPNMHLNDLKRSKSGIHDKA